MGAASDLLRHIEPGIATPLDPNPKPGRQRRQSYSEIERTTALMTAALVGVAKASEDLGIPKRTIYQWIDEAGGIGPMSDAAHAALGATQFGTALGVCAELDRRLPSMSVKELLAAMKVLSAGAAKSYVEDAGPAAKKPIQVVIQETGEVIDLDRAIPDRRSSGSSLAR